MKTDSEWEYEIEALSTLLRDTTAGVLAFALYRGIPDRHVAENALKERLPFEVRDVVCTSSKDDPFELFSTLPSDKRIVVFVYELEKTLPEAAGILNLQRERLLEGQHAFVFWVREYALRELAEKAPDFWAWRSGAFDFRREEPGAFIALETERTEIQIEPPDIDKEKRLLEIHLSQLESMKDQVEIIGQQLKIANTYSKLRDFKKAEFFALQALRSGIILGRDDLKVQAYRCLGEINFEANLFLEALHYYEIALELHEAAFDKDSQEISQDLRYLGMTWHRLGSPRKAMEYLDKALAIDLQMYGEEHPLVAEDYFLLGTCRT